MVKKLFAAAIIVIACSFKMQAKNSLQSSYHVTGDTTVPVAPQRVYLVSQHETTSLMAASLRDIRELKVEDSKEVYKVVRFRITFDPGNGQVFGYFNFGNYFRPELIYHFRNLKPKTLISISDIELISTNGQQNKGYPKIINTW